MIPIIYSQVFHLQISSMKHLLLLMIFPFIISGLFSQIRPEVVKEVDLQRYQGTWYEIARLPNSFEKGLICTTAQYTLKENGKVRVVNKGFKEKNKQKQKTAKGIAKVPDPKDPGKLKVSFFRPFYGDYWILELDKDYQWVLVGGTSLKYLWILSRTKQLDDGIYQKLVQRAKNEGYAVENLIKVDQDCDN